MYLDYLNEVDSLKQVKFIALTFDDGPDSLYTPLILDVLKEKKVTATFFLIGEKMKRYPEVTKRIFTEGHCMANHTFSHIRFLDKSITVIYNDLMQTEKLINSVCGNSQKIFRPPFGRITKKQNIRLLKLGFKIVLWNLDSKDYISGSTKDNIVNKVISEAGNDKVVLFHSADYSGKKSRMNTVMALPEIIDKLRSQNYVFVKVNQ